MTTAPTTVVEADAATLPTTITDQPAAPDARAAPDALAGGAWRHGQASGMVTFEGSCPSCDRFVAVDAHRTRQAVTSPELAAQLLVPRLAASDRERCLAAMLDTKHRVLSIAVISVGSIDHTFMSPREVFRDALLANAAAVVLAHNHPSGDPEPSADDRAVTARLVEAGKLIGVQVLDHLVVGDGGWVSLARRGAL